jgi:hypothetical protein
MNLLRWNRKIESTAYDADLRKSTIINQDYLRNTYQLVPTADNPWDTNTFRQWKYFVTNLCLSAVQDALKSGDYSKNLQYLFSPDRSEDTIGAARKSKSNVQGLLLYHPILLSSPWQAPEDLDAQITALLKATEPILVARSIKEDGHTSYDKDNALKQLETLKTSISSTLTRIYTLTSHCFHVLLRDLIPRARADKSNLFTHIKGARTDHIINLRAHHGGKRKEDAAEMTKDELRPHSAAHTLNFIEEEYVEKDDDASHYTWNDILNAVRLPKMTLFAWVESFTLRALRYSETIERISGARLTKINKLIAKQITDEEKLTISTLDSAYSAIRVQEGDYIFADLVKLLAQNVTSFNKKYNPTDHPRINTYLRTRARKHGPVPDFMQSSSGGNGQKGKRKTHAPSTRPQRAWSYLQESQPSSLVSPAPYGKGKSKGDSKGKGKRKGKGKSKGKGKHQPKGKGSGKGGWSSAKGKAKGLNPKGKEHPKGNSFLPRPASTTAPAGANTGTPAPVRCHFCHIVGHIKPNCRKWLALQHSDQYQSRHTHDQKYQLIYDHLEDSVLAPRQCIYCADAECDGSDCQSTFDHQDFNEASAFFASTINPLVLNAKLDRPLDSHAPQHAASYAYEDDDWGDVEESYDQEQYDINLDNETWDAETPGEEDYDHEEYDMDHDEEEVNQAVASDSEDQDEDDQGNYN